MKLGTAERSVAEDLLAQLVAIRSPSGEEAACAEFCAQWLLDRGLDVEIVDRSVLARVTGGPGPRILLNTHIDTVPAGEDWLDDPWHGRWEDDRLVGLGANDAKGCVAAMMYAAATLATDRSFEGELVLALNHEEETTNRGMEAILPRIGQVDLAVTGEPTGLQVVRAQAGLGVIVASWKGHSCHAAHVSRVEHENALLSAARELAALPKPHVLAGEHELLGPSTLTPTVMRAGERHNSVPDLAEVTFDARLAAPHDVDECLAILRTYLPGAELWVRSRRLAAVETPADHPLVVSALKHSNKPAPIGSNTLSDMALLPGIPAIKCGPGETVRSHTANEFLTRDELHEAAVFYTQLVPDALASSASETLGGRSS
jgi:acetylornithine deacetylase